MRADQLAMHDWAANGRHRGLDIGSGRAGSEVACDDGERAGRATYRHAVGRASHAQLRLQRRDESIVLVESTGSALRRGRQLSSHWLIV